MAAVDDPGDGEDAKALFAKIGTVRGVARELGINPMAAGRLIHGDRMYGRGVKSRGRAQQASAPSSPPSVVAPASERVAVDAGPGGGVALRPPHEIALGGQKSYLGVVFDVPSGEAAFVLQRADERAGALAPKPDPVELQQIPADFRPGPDGGFWAPRKPAPVTTQRHERESFGSTIGRVLREISERG